MSYDPSTNPDRFDSIAGIWHGTSGQFILWMHETKTGECKITWNFGSGNKITEFKDYDSAQAHYTILLKQVL